MRSINFKNTVIYLLIMTMILVIVTGCSSKDTSSDKTTSSKVSQNNASSDSVSSSDTESSSVSQVESSVSSVTSSSPKPVISSTPTVNQNNVSQTPVTPPNIQVSGYKYNTNLDITDNLFVDSLVYTGYNLAKHNADGNRWVYILASQKRGLGYLSNIGYAGGSSGYETNAYGKPDIAAFERKGLVCASFVTYVYFNYLPNVAGIDTSSLTRPAKSYSAHDWYMAALDWVNKGYSELIPFTATNGYANFINFSSSKEIPIGSILVCYDVKKSKTHGSHVAIYVGYKNGNHWVIHVGNDNGPEFCSIERMNCGPDPHWPLAIISTPSNIRFSAALEIEVKDSKNNAISGLDIKIKNKSNGTIYSPSITDSNGKSIIEKIPYGEYEIIYPELAGYSTENLINTVTLNTQNNSLNKLTVTLNKKEEPSPQSDSSSEVSSVISSESQSTE